MADSRKNSISDIRPPPPREPRIIRPSNNFLWKNYFILILTYISFTVVFAIIIIGIGLFITSVRPSRVDLAVDMALFMGLIYITFCLVTLPSLLIGVTLYIRSMEFIVHGDEIVVRKGLINKSEKHVPYRTVTNIDMRSGPFDRLFNIGTVEIQTAGGGGMSLEDTATEKLEGIKVYREVRDYIVSQLRQFQSLTKTSDQEIKPEITVEADQHVVDELREIKYLLRDKLALLEKKIDDIDSKLS
ncbi:MAG: PH domain-containing protein [Candidatus Hodarchaeales archaeon]